MGLVKAADAIHQSASIAHHHAVLDWQTNGMPVDQVVRNWFSSLPETPRQLSLGLSLEQVIIDAYNGPEMAL